MKTKTLRIPNGSPVTTAENLAELQNGTILRAAHGWARYLPGCYRVGRHNKPFNQSLEYRSDGDGVGARKALSALSAFHA